MYFQTKIKLNKKFQKIKYKLSKRNNKKSLPKHNSECVYVLKQNMSHDNRVQSDVIKKLGLFNDAELFKLK